MASLRPIMPAINLNITRMKLPILPIIVTRYIDLVLWAVVSILLSYFGDKVNEICPQKQDMGDFF